MSNQKCIKCEKNTASVFAETIKGGEVFTEGFCLDCAREMGLKTQKEHPKSSRLDEFGVSLTKKATEGKIGKIIGRDKEIRQIIEVLCGRKKNNPVLLGEPGVGKTVLVEWIAKLILDGKVPEKLKNKEVFQIEVTEMMAGTGFSGTLEENIKVILDEVDRRGDVILFIDEIHRIKGAGVTVGDPHGDIANILKNSLTSDGFMLIGATTPTEYRNIEDDPALERRFQPIILEEPSIEETISILTGTKDVIESYYDITISESVSKLAVMLADKYIMDRFRPDNAITLVERAARKLYVSNDLALSENKPVTRELEDRDLRIAIEEMTKIPVANISDDDTKQLLQVESKMKEKIIGQDDAIVTVCSAIKRKRVGTSKKLKPASFIFIGSSGVGKTEFAKRLNEELFGKGGKLIRLDMSEYMTGNLTKILGTRYLNTLQKGQLTDVRTNPFCVVLLDEIEKAHPDVMNIFLQVLDDGHLTDGTGKKLNFKHAIIIMTTNAGSTIKENAVGFNRKANQDNRQKAEDALKQFLRPELINRVDEIVYFNILTEENIRDISRLVLDEFCKAMVERDPSVKVTYSESMLDFLAENAYSEEYGARNLRRYVQKEIEAPVADAILKNHTNPITEIELSVSDDAIKISNNSGNN